MTKKDRITVTVRQEDIQKGVPCNSRQCAVALAARREIPSDYTVSVLDTKLQLFQSGVDSKGFREFLLPPEAIFFVEEFDSDKRNSNPFNFTLDIEYPTNSDTGTALCTPVSVPFDLDEGIEPSTYQLHKLKKELFG